MTRRPRRRRAHRPRPRARLARRRVTVALVATLIVAGAAVALLVRASRPPQSQPFRFPPAVAPTPTVEISAAERAGLEHILDQLYATPGDGTPVRR